MTNFNNPAAADYLVGLWDFRSGEETHDTGLADGIAQNGHLEGGASISGDRLHTDGSHDYFDVSGDDNPFDLSTGTIEVQFTQDCHVGTSPDTIVNRGEAADIAHEGYFAIQVTLSGQVQVIHCMPGGVDSILTTDAGFFNEGDTLNVVYSFDEATGNSFTVTNLTQNTETTIESTTTGLNLAVGDNDDENFTFGAREADDGHYDHFFDGSIDYVAVYNTDSVPGLNGPDGIVDGESTGEVMAPLYDDADGATDGGGDIIDGPDGANDTILGNGGDDTIDAGLGDDLVSGGSGDDVIDGNVGNDTIFGDQSDAVGPVTREVFKWDLAPNTGAPDFSQDTGSVIVTFSETDGGATDNISTDLQNVADIDTGDLGAVDATSSLDSETGVQGASDTYTLGFSDPVQNVSFRVNDIDGDGVVRITALDANGQPIEVILEGGANLTLLDTDGVAGADTADSNGGYLEDTSDEYSVLVTIPGPVSEIQIFHTQDGGNNSGINVTDVYFDVVEGSTDLGPAGNDEIDGGEGDDLIYGDNGGGSVAGSPTTMDIDDLSGGSITSQDGSVTADVSQSGFSVQPAGFLGADSDVFFAERVSGTDQATLTFDFQEAAKDVSFTLFDVNDGANGSYGDWDDQVTIIALDENGNQVPVTFSGGDININGNTIEGNSASSTAPLNDTNADNVQVSISGPIVSLQIIYEDGPDDLVSGYIGVSDLEVTAANVGGEDGEGGNDTIEGGEGADTIYGEGGDDTFLVGSAAEGAGDVIDGGNGPDETTDNDVLDLRGAGPVTIDQTADANDDGATTGTVTFEDGSTLTFEGIETILTDPINEDPDAVNDTASGDEDTDITGNVLANDTDANPGDTLEVVDFTQPANGTVTVDPDGAFTYTPDADFNGTDSFTYTVSDGNGGTDTATVTLTVDPVNDDPIAVNDSDTVDEDGSVIINVLGNDSDVDAGDVLSVAPVVGDLDPANGTAVLNGDGTITYTPDADFTGTDTFTYTVSDGNGGFDQATVTVTVDPTADAPIAVDDSRTVDEDDSIDIDVLANDSDADGDTLDIVSFTQPANGTVTENPDGTLKYTPNADFTGTDSFTYTITDNDPTTPDATATVNLVVDPTADAPIVVDDTGAGDEDTDITGNVLDNDSDPDGDTLEVVDFTQPANGTVTVNPDGSYTYTPDEDYAGPDSFTYTVSDGDPTTPDVVGTVELTVTAVDDAPEATDDPFVVSEDQDPAAVVGNVLDNDTDADPLDAGLLEVSEVAGSAPGTPVAGSNGGLITINPDGTVSFDPNGEFDDLAPGETAETTVEYTVTDPSGQTDTATVTFTVNGVNDDPDAVDDSNSTAFETAVVIDVLANDTDVDNAPTDLVVTDISVDPAEGTLAPTGTEGQYTFTPADGFEGTATVTYTISDGAGGTDTATHTIVVGDDPTPQDGVVDGEETGEEMILGYDDSNLPTDGGGDIVTDGDDVIEGNGGDDTIDGAGGNDDIDGGADDDSITGGEGDDTIAGGEGSDTLAGGAGEDLIDGGAGDDDIAVGGDDIAAGGTGDDVFTVDPTDPAADVDVVLDGGFDGTDGNPNGPENGDAGDVLDLGDLTDDLDVVFGTDPESGTVDGVDAFDGEDDITFDEIEKVITGSGDDTVDGTDATGPIDVETGDGADDVTGGAGDDTVDAGVGDDTVDGGAGDDSIAAGDGDDVVDGGEGNDTIDAGAGDDAVDGGAGDDTLDGGDGSDTIAGGEGADVIDGGDGDDDIVVGAGDTANGGIGDDVFTVDPTLTGDAPITVDGGSDGTQPGDEAGPENGDDGDVLDLRGLDLVSLVYDETDPSFDPVLGVGEKGTAVYNNDAGDPVTIEFSEIEIVLHDPLPDGVVDGEETGEDMGPGYDDGDGPTDGGGDIIDGPDGDDDVIDGNGGDDTINAGQGSDTVSGGEGDDSIVGGASDDGDELSGDEGDDTIQGGGGDDTIDGGADDDVIEGGTGDDDITGGDGNDSVVGGDGNDTIDTSGSNPATDLDTPNIPPFITGAPGDTAPGDDLDTVDGGAGNDSITTGDDADVIFGGTGEDTIDGGIDADTIDGGADADSIIGGEGSDSIFGGGGDDTIYGGLDSTAPDVLDVADDGFNSPIGPDPVDNNGDDFIDGGAGNDLIFGNDDDDTILGGTGNDTIDGGVDDDSIQGGQGADVIEGGHGQDFIQGNNDDDVISGGRGSDTLEGNAGNDTITGGAGDSIIGGGDADSIFIDQDEVDENGDNDTAIFVEANTFGDDNDTLDLTDFVAHRNLVETPDGDGDSTSGSVEVQNDDGEWVEVTFGEIENLLLPPQAPDAVVDGEEFGELMDPLYDDADGPTDGGGDIIDGPDGDDDSINGNGGEDTINAGAGNDTVDGGDDNDTVNGNTGDDIVGGGAGDDLVTGGFGDDTVLGGEGDDVLRGNVGNDSLVGGDGNDSMGGAEDDDTLEGGAGMDTLTGGSGDDVLDGGLDDDTINGSSGNDTIEDLDGDNLITSGPDGLPDLGVPFVPGTTDEDDDPNDDRDSITTGAGNDTINAGDDADTIDAGDGDNVIDGGFDADIITSGDGNDEILGGEGSDTINSGAGDDTIQGGIGTDAANLIDDNVNPANNDDILDNGDDLINAGDGNDLVFGEDDNDTIDGGAGNDTLDGGIDDDTITGGEGNDSIVGGQGADSLDGGEGNDTFSVGTFTDPVFGDDYVEGLGDTIIGGEDPDDNDEDVLDLTGAGPLKVVFDDAVDPTGTPGESGTVIFYTDDTQTTVAGTLEFKEIENVIPCFTPGAMIATPRGEVPVETLREGDRVITRDNGIQEIRWTGSRTLNRAELAEGENLKPILIKAGSLGRNLPERDMLVSPQHRVLITGESPQLYFEESEVLVAAKHLVGKTGVSVVDTMRTTYIHFMFDHHEVVLSDGAWTESFQPGDQTLGSMGEATREEIFALFPELATKDGLKDYAAARRSLKAHEAKLLRL